MKHKHALVVLLFVVCLGILSLVLIGFYQRQLQLEEQVQAHEYNWKHFDGHTLEFTGFGEVPVYSIGERRFGFAVTKR